MISTHSGGVQTHTSQSTRCVGHPRITWATRQQYHLGFFGARHCRLRVSCNPTIPDRTYELNGRTATEPLTMQNFDPSRPGYRVPLNRPAAKCCDFERCLVNQFNFFYNSPGELPRYSALYQNSNNFVDNLVRACGGQVQFPTFLLTLDPYYWFNYYGQNP